MQGGCGGDPSDDDSADDGDPCDDGFIEDDGDCVPETCGTGTWGALETDGDTVFVDGNAGDDGDGTADAPLQHIQDGLDLAAERGGGLVAVAAGTYTENLQLGDEHDRVTLAGRCMDMVTVDGSAGEEDAPAVLVDGVLDDTLEYGLSGLTIVEGPWTGIAHRAGTLTIEDTVLDRNHTFGLMSWGSATTTLLSRVTIRETRPYVDGRFGRGINVELHATVVAESCLLEHNAADGVFVQDDDSSVQLTDVAIRETQLDGDGENGRGISVQDNASLQATSCLLEGNHDVAVYASSEDAFVHLVDVEIRDTRPDAEGLGGRGIGVYDGASLLAEGCLLEHNTEIGLRVDGEGAEAHLIDTVIRETWTGPDGMSGRGMTVQNGAQLTAESCLLDGNVEHGIFASGGSVVQLFDVEIRDTQPRIDGMFGRGIEISWGALLEAESCLLDGNAEASVLAADFLTEAYLTDVTIRDTKFGVDGIYGRALSLQNGASMVAESCLLENNGDMGLFASGDATTALLTDIEILDSRRSANSQVAVGLVSQRNADVQGSGIRVHRTEGPALFASDHATLACTDCDLQDFTFAGAVAWYGATLELTDGAISGGAPDANLGGGVGVYVSDRDGTSTLLLQGTSISEQPYAAVWLSGDGSYRLVGNDLAGGVGLELATINVHGDAVFAMNGVTTWDGASGLLLQDNTLRDSSGAGILLDASSATQAGNSYVNNTTDLVQQRCDGVEPPMGYEEAPVVELCPDFDRVVVDFDFQLRLEDGETLQE